MINKNQSVNHSWVIQGFVFSIACCVGIFMIFSQFGSTVASESIQASQTWPPEHLDIGMSEPNSDPPALFQVPSGTRYRQQYLSGGANYGWTTWNQNGDFAKFYIEGTVALGKTPIFTYYNICQSGHGGGGNGNHPCYSDEQSTIKNNLADAGTMRAYWDDLKLFYEKAAEFPNQTVILHVEPDMWGHTQLLASNDDANQYPNSVMVSGSGHPDLAGMPNTIPGFAQALFKLRETAGANNVLIAYHVSSWGVRDDFVYSNPDSTKLISLSNQSVAYYQSLGQTFDLTFFEMRDRDAGYYQFIRNLPDAWWQSNDFENHINWINNYTTITGQDVMIWQIPYGNTKRPIMDNTWNHYQDNLVETLLGESDYQTLNRYKDAGVVALIFGQGAGGTTCPCDIDNDGQVDDGGYFYEVASNYINNNLISLKGLLVTFSLKVDGIQLSWNDSGANSYEVWWGDTSNLVPGNDCFEVPNCVFTSEQTYSATLPDGVSERYFIVLYRENGQIAEAAPAIKSVRLTDFFFLPVIGR